MSRRALSIRFLIETAIAAVIAFIFGRTLIAYFFYYDWETHYLWFIAFCFFSLLAILAWGIACVVALYKKYTAKKFRKILMLLIGGWMSAALVVTSAVFIQSYNSHVFTFLYRLQQATTAQQRISIENLTDFSWEKLCFLQPYGSEESLRELLGKEYILGQVNTSNEGLSYLIFLLPDKHSLVIGIPRGVFDSPKCLDYQEAKFLKL